MYTKESSNCVLGTLGNYLSIENPQFDASFIFFLLDKMNFSYTGLLPELKDVKISNSISRVYYEFIDKFNLNSKFIQTKTRNLQKILNTCQLPLIIEVATKKLKYHQLYISNNWDMTHFITVLENHKKNLLISDCYIPTIDKYVHYEGLADFKNIQKAWRKNNRWIFLDLDLKEFSKTYKITDEFCKNLFIQNARLFLENTYECQNKFADDFEKLIEQYDTQQLKTELPNLALKLQIAGVLASRYYLFEFVKDHLLCQENEVLDFIQNDIKTWKQIIFGISKASISLRTKSFESVKKSILNISENEKKFFEEMLIKLERV